MGRRRRRWRGGLRASAHRLWKPAPSGFRGSQRRRAALLGLRDSCANSRTTAHPLILSFPTLRVSAPDPGYTPVKWGFLGNTLLLYTSGFLVATQPSTEPEWTRPSVTPPFGLSHRVLVGRRHLVRDAPLEIRRTVDGACFWRGARNCGG